MWGGLSAVDARRQAAALGGQANLRGRVAAGLWSFVAGLAGVVLVAQVKAAAWRSPLALFPARSSFLTPIGNKVTGDTHASELGLGGNRGMQGIG